MLMYVLCVPVRACVCCVPESAEPVLTVCAVCLCACMDETAQICESAHTHALQQHSSSMCQLRKHAYCEGVPECTRMCFLCWVRTHAYCDGVSECTRMCFLCWVRKHVYSGVNDVYIGLARTIYIRCICGTLGRDSTKYTVYIYGSGQPYVYSDVNARACAFYVVCVSKHVYSDHVNAGACGFLCWVRE